MAILKANNSFLKANGKILNKLAASYPWYVDGVTIGSHTYPAVRINNKIFLRFNLDEPIGSDGKYYNNNEQRFGWNGYKCGRLYTFNTVENLITSKLLEWGLSEWRVPSIEDMTDIRNFVVNLVGPNSIYMMATPNAMGAGFPPQTWDGVDYFGFSMLPSGQLYSGMSYNIDRRGGFWTSDRVSSTQARIVAFEYPTYPNWGFSSSGVDEGFSIRLCKDV